MKTPLLSLGLAFALCAATLCGCGKAKEAISEKVSQKATEKMIESQLAKDGTKASVDLSGDGVKATTTDEKGGVTQMEMGGAKVSEAEVGLPFYPGAKVVEKEGTRMITPTGRMVAVTLESSDASDKLANFYRDKLKPMSEGKQLMDMSAGDGNTSFNLIDGKANTSLMVTISKETEGSKVTLMASSQTEAKK